MMGITTIKFCDMCGKRTDNLPFILTLFHESKKQYSKRTMFSKRICVLCGKKIGSIDFEGDRLTEKIERAIDKIKINQTKMCDLDRHMTIEELGDEQ